MMVGPGWAQSHTQKIYHEGHEHVSGQCLNMCLQVCRMWQEWVPSRCGVAWCLVYQYSLFRLVIFSALSHWGLARSHPNCPGAQCYCCRCPVCCVPCLVCPASSREIAFVTTRDLSTFLLVMDLIASWESSCGGGKMTSLAMKWLIDRA